MASIFLEPGGDSTFNTDPWDTVNGTVTIVSDIVHGGHQRSMKFGPSTNSYIVQAGVVTDSGGRVSMYIYFNALPAASETLWSNEKTGDGSVIVGVQITSGGVLQLVQSDSKTQIGSNGSTLTTGVWYRLCLAWTITNSTTNQFRLFKNGSLDVTVSNTTLTNTASADLAFGNGFDTTMDTRYSDIYLDNSTALTDPGDVWVTAKRPISNGTANNFTTQIGSGGSGVGTGHSPQVNERPASTTNGWAVTSAGSAITEEYNIQAASAGDIDISAATIVDYMGWMETKALIAETVKLIVNNAQTNTNITTSIDYYKAIAGSSTYPAGTGTDIGEITATTVTTVSLYECGINIAYIPGAAAPTTNVSWKSLLGVGQ